MTMIVRASPWVFALRLAMALVCVPVAASESPDWSTWQHLRVSDGERIQPLDSLARTMLQRASLWTSISDPGSGEPLSATALYVQMLLEWHGWDDVSPGVQHAAAGSLHLPYPDRWDRLPLWRVDAPPLRRALGLQPDQRHISPLEVSRSKVQLRDRGGDTPLLIWAAQLAARNQESLAPLERQALHLAGEFRDYLDWRGGRQLKCVPRQGRSATPEAGHEWLSLSEVVGTPWDSTNDPLGLMRSLRDRFLAARRAYLAGDLNQFDCASMDLRDLMSQAGRSCEAYPSSRMLSAEVFWNQWRPFRWAWILFLLAAAMTACGARKDWKWCRRSGWTLAVSSLLVVLVGLVLRSVVTGRVLVAGISEWGAGVASGAVLLGWTIALLDRRSWIMSVAALVAAVSLWCADSPLAALVLPRQPLTPDGIAAVSWIVHGISLSLGLSALALAWGLANAALLRWLRTDEVPIVCQGIGGDVARAIHRCLTIGVLCLVTGLVSGAIHADLTQGRFWSWQPHEIWLLLTLVSYMGILQAAATGRIAAFGLAVCNAGCFMLVLMTWFVATFLLGADGRRMNLSVASPGFVLLIMIMQLGYVSLSVYRYRRVRELASRRAPSVLIANDTSR